MFLSIAGVPTEDLDCDGEAFITSFQEVLGDEPVDPYAAYGAQAAVVLLDAIERAGGTDRAKIAEEIFNTEVTGGILGDFQIGENGDPERRRRRLHDLPGGGAARDRDHARPKQETVDAALGN